MKSFYASHPYGPGILLFALVVSVCLSISALYELFEWIAAVSLVRGADAFLATQGPGCRKTCSGIGGAILAQILRTHDQLGSNLQHYDELML
jgi:uncharacterized membrane protein YjdF